MRPARISARSQATSGNSLSESKHDWPPYGPRPWSHIYRDSSGRLRQEPTFGIAAHTGPKRPAVMINDPVAGIFYVLKVNRKIAHRLVIPKSPDGRTHSMIGYKALFTVRLAF
jgi:hypothetical protein